MRYNKAQKSWILYDMANAGYALVVRTTFAAILYKALANNSIRPELATSYWGYVSSGAGILAAILTPWLGAVADVNSTKKFYLAIFLSFGVVSTAFMGFVSNGSANLVLLLYFISLSSYMCSNSFYDSLLLNVSSRGGVNRISSIGYALGYVGGVVPYLISLVVLYFVHDKMIGVRTSFIVTALWWCLLSIPLFLFVKEQQRKSKDNISSHSIIQDGIGGFKQLFNTARDIGKYRNILIYLIAYFLYIDGVGTILLMAVPYGKDVGITDNMLIFAILALQFLAFPFTLLYGNLAKKYSAKRMIYVAIGVYILIAAMAGAMPFTSDANIKKILFFSSAFLLATSQGGIQSLSRSYFSGLIPVNKSAEFFGFYNIFGKFTTIVGPLLVGLTTVIFGHSGYGMASLIIPFSLGAILLTRVKSKRANI